jgi:hypothetical protein
MNGGRFMRRRNFLLTAGATTLASTSLAGAAPAAAAPASTALQDAQEALLGVFSKYEVVAGMSPSHGLRDVDDFLISLIRNPRLPYTVNDIAVEGGNSLYQPILDRYIAGEDVPSSEVQKVWRNITQPGGGYSTFYQQVYPLVRRVNQTLPEGKKLRVLACDPPIDWSKVKSPADFDAFLSERDQSIASVMENEVLSRHRKALMLIGWGHILHRRGAAAQIYEQRYPGVTFTIVNHEGFAKDNDQLERRMAPWPVPSLTPFKGTWLGELDSSYFSLPGDAPQPPGTGYPGADGYLYLGPRDFLLHQPISASAILDQDFLAEMERRATVIQAPPGTPWYPSAMFQQEKESSAFFYDSDQ